jgi:hypothetical protein
MFVSPRKQTSVSYAADCDIIACYGGAKLTDKHLASKVHCVDEEIFEWLERRKRDTICEAGAPELNAIRRLHPVSGLPCDISQAIAVPLASEQMVAVAVGDCVLLLPEHVLDAAASALRSASGEYVGLRDYADSVGPLLEVLQRRGPIEILA